MIYANHDEDLARAGSRRCSTTSPAARGSSRCTARRICFLNSPKYIELVGAQFQRHGTGTFRTILAEDEHPITRGFGGFESWDETYVHTKHNEKDRTVLEWRQEGDRKEPWTWVRTHGKGRVFYTAWGHDQRTWGNPGFQNLVERGIRWAVGDDPGVVPAFAAAWQAARLPGSTAGETPAPQMTAKRTDVKPFEYVEANVPIYPPAAAGGRWPPRRSKCKSRSTRPSR